MYSQDNPSVESEKYYVLYDLETSGKNTIGQILTGFFVLLDKDFQEVPGFVLKVKISPNRLDLPHPQAILTNGIKIFSDLTDARAESKAATDIRQFLEKIIGYCKDATIYLTGFNSSRFDQTFLRVTLIRNGLDPYFKGKLKNLDVLDLARYVASLNPSFPHIINTEAENPYPFFTLESLTRRFSLLNQEQSHDSEEDAWLTRDLLKFMIEEFHFNLDEYLARPQLPDIFEAFDNFKLGDSGAVPVHSVYSVLNRERNSYLLVNLDKFKEQPDKDSIKYFNTNNTVLIPRDVQDAKEYGVLRNESLQMFKGIRVSNFFPTTECDIEQDIYRMPINLISTLGTAIMNEKSRALPPNQDLRTLYRRHVLRESQSNDINSADEYFIEVYDKYVKHRYVDGMRIDKGSPEPKFSDSWELLNDELNELMNTEFSTMDDNKKEALTELREFYDKSEVRQSLIRLRSIT